MRKALLCVLLALALPAVAVAQPFADIVFELAGDGPHTVAPCGADPVAQIEVWVSSDGIPVELLASDLWLASPVLEFCVDGNYADSSTYPPIQATPLSAGPASGASSPMPTAQTCRWRSS